MRTYCERLNYWSFELLHVVPRAIVKKVNSSNGSSANAIATVLYKTSKKHHFKPLKTLALVL